METIAINNVLEDDQLINLIKENFNENDMQLFNLNYKIYITYRNNPNDYIVNFDDIYLIYIYYNKLGN
jgi:accessory colonization factor AcfC